MSLNPNATEFSFTPAVKSQPEPSAASTAYFEQPFPFDAYGQPVPQYQWMSGYGVPNHAPYGYADMVRIDWLASLFATNQMHIIVCPPVGISGAFATGLPHWRWIGVQGQQQEGGASRRRKGGSGTVVVIKNLPCVSPSFRNTRGAVNIFLALARIFACRCPMVAGTVAHLTPTIPNRHRCHYNRRR